MPDAWGASARRALSPVLPEMSLMCSYRNEGRKLGERSITELWQSHPPKVAELRMNVEDNSWIEETEADESSDMSNSEAIPESYIHGTSEKLANVMWFDTAHHDRLKFFRVPFVFVPFRLLQPLPNLFNLIIALRSSRHPPSSSLRDRSLLCEYGTSREAQKGHRKAQRVRAASW